MIDIQKRAKRMKNEGGHDWLRSLVMWRGVINIEIPMTLFMRNALPCYADRIYG